MAMGKRESEQQQDLFITHDKLPRSAGHVFYCKLNQLLGEGGFDRWIEALCEPYYCQGQGRPSVPPGQYFRMLLVGYFEGINSQRGIAWRCSDSLSLPRHSAAERARRADLRSCLRDGRSQKNLAQRHRERAETLPAVSRRSQPGRTPALPVQDGHATRPATVQNRPGGACFVFVSCLPCRSAVLEPPLDIVGLTKRSMRLAQQRDDPRARRVKTCVVQQTARSVSRLKCSSRSAQEPLNLSAERNHKRLLRKELATRGAQENFKDERSERSSPVGQSLRQA
jgi:hypothetical protein